MLAPTSYTAPESVAVGGGGGSGVGKGAPLRYDFTSRAFHALSPWNAATFAYSILQLYKGYNPISNLEVVSSLNILSQSTNMYHYYYGYCLQKYAPKLYLGTLQTTAQAWLYDNFNGTVTDQIYTKNIWPKNYQQDSQKGEANLSHLKIC